MNFMQRNTEWNRICCQPPFAEVFANFANPNYQALAVLDKADGVAARSKGLRINHVRFSDPHPGNH